MVVDWAHWQATASAPTSYDPPQLKPNYRKMCPRLDWYGLRSSLCTPIASAVRCAACTTPVSLRDLETLV